MGEQEATNSMVTRNGKLITIPSVDVVVGDIIEIEKDRRIATDCILIHANDMSCEEADLTGESESRYKSHVTGDNFERNPCPFLFRGTITKTGTGRAVVVAVGERTNTGKAEKDHPNHPFQWKSTQHTHMHDKQ